MQLITCRNGHRYDPTLTSECPECAMFNSGVTIGEGMMDMGGYHQPEFVGETVDLNAGMNMGGDDGGHTIPLKKPEAMGGFQVQGGYQAQGGYGGTRMTEPAVEEYGATMAVDRDGKFVSKKEQKTTGWLVCISGPEKGKDYRLHNDNNFIGRNQSNDVSIPVDATVSGEKHCVITYDRVDRIFYIGLSAGASIIRLNGRPVLMTQELKHGDRIQIGQGMFLFVPLCGENFEWEE